MSDFFFCNNASVFTVLFCAVQKIQDRTSLAVQWLRPCFHCRGHVGLIPGRTTKIQAATVRHGNERKKIKERNKYSENNSFLLHTLNCYQGVQSSIYSLTIGGKTWFPCLVPRIRAHFEQPQAVEKCAAQPRGKHCLYQCDLGKRIGISSMTVNLSCKREYNILRFVNLGELSNININVRLPRWHQW